MPRLPAVLRFALVLVLLYLAGCAEPARFTEVAGALPPIPPGQARLFIYRDEEPYETVARPPMYLNDRPIGSSIPGGVFFCDVPAGTYKVSILSLGLYANQFKTLTAGPGDVRYIKVESLKAWAEGGDAFPNTFVIALMDNQTGREQLADMAYAGQRVWPH